MIYIHERKKWVIRVNFEGIIKIVLLYISLHKSTDILCYFFDL